MERYDAMRDDLPPPSDEECEQMNRQAWVVHDDALARNYLACLGLRLGDKVTRVSELEVSIDVDMAHIDAFRQLDSVSLEGMDKDGYCDACPGCDRCRALDYKVHVGQAWMGELKGTMDCEYFDRASKNMSRSIVLESHVGRPSTISLKFLPENEL